MGKPGRKSPFMAAGSWQANADETLQVRVPAGFKSMLEQAAHEQGTSCSSLVRYSVLRQVVGQAEANRLEPMTARNPQGAYDPLPLFGLITAVEDDSKKP